MVLIWIIIFLFSVFQVIKFSLENAKKMKEYQKTMPKKMVKVKIANEMTKKNKFFYFLMAFSWFFILFSMSGENDKSNKQSKKTTRVEIKKEEKKEEVATTEETKKEETKEEEKDPYKEIEEDISRKFPKLRKIVATDIGVVLEIKVTSAPTKNMMVQEMFRETRRYIKEIEKQYRVKDLTYENITIQFFYPMSDGKTSGIMKILQLNVENDMIKVAFAMPTIQEEVEKNFNKF